MYKKRKMTIQKTKFVTITCLQKTSLKRGILQIRVLLAPVKTITGKKIVKIVAVKSPVNNFKRMRLKNADILSIKKR